MRDFWKKIRHDCKGAVTVFVTLMLIPMVLVSGTGVDLARSYAAKSILQDANQLAANSVLTQYDTLLQDVYGLFGIMSKDPDLATMVNDYLKVAVFGEDWKDKTLGSFQLFYGSELQSSGVTPAGGKNLGNADILRRQIEEYAKLRAPVIIVEKIMDTLDQFQKIAKDADAIKTKMEIDDKIEEIDKLFKDFYEQIKTANAYQKDEDEAYKKLNAALDEVDDQLEALYQTREEYEQLLPVTREEDIYIQERLDDVETHYDGILENIQKTIRGGKIQQGWHNGGENEDGEWEDGYWQGKSSTLTGVNKAKSNLKEAVGKYESILDKLIEKGGKIDEKNNELQTLVNQLEAKLKNCSESMQTAMTKTEDKNGKTMIENYRDLLKYPVKPMATAMKEHDWSHITEVKNAMDSFAYGDQSGGIENLTHLDTLNEIRTSIPHWASIDYKSDAGNGYSASEDKLLYLKNLTEKQYHTKAPGDSNSKYKLFQDGKFNDTHNKDFFDKLSSMYDASTKEKNKKDNAKNLIKSIFKSVQTVMKGLNFIPDQGATYYKTENGNSNDAFGLEGDWGKEDVGKDKTKEALDSDTITGMGSLLEKAADKIILLTYDTEMFSCWTVEEGDETMSGIPLSTKMNYFYQSEQEYLFGGSKTATANLAEVAGMLLIVRLVFNYVASFVIDEVREIVDTIKAALSWLGLIGIGIAEGVRIAIAIGESVIDVARLRSGAEDVAVFKIGEGADDWRLSLRGLVNSALDAVKESAIADKLDSAIKDASTEEKPSYPALTYQDYLRIFLLTKDGDTLTNRTKDLIQFNMTNYNNGINAEETEMTKAELYKLSERITDFSVTATVDLKMLFLSMPFAQKGVNGVIPPGTLRLTATDYRGY